MSICKSFCPHAPLKYNKNVTDLQCIFSHAIFCTFLFVFFFDFSVETLGFLGMASFKLSDSESHHPILGTFWVIWGHPELPKVFLGNFDSFESFEYNPESHSVTQWGTELLELQSSFGANEIEKYFWNLCRRKHNIKAFLQLFSKEVNCSTQKIFKFWPKKSGE